MKKKSHGKILRGELKEQHLSTILNSCFINLFIDYSLIIVLNNIIEILQI